MLSEPFLLLKNYRQQQDALKLSQKQKLNPIQKRLVKKTSKSKQLTTEKKIIPEWNQNQPQQFIEPLIHIQQYSDDQMNEDQYSPLLFNEFKFTFHDSYCENLNLSEDAFGI